MPKTYFRIFLWFRPTLQGGLPCMLNLLKTLLVTFILALMLVFATPVEAAELAGSSAALIKSNAYNPDKRALKLKKFLLKVNSPLADYSQVFVDAADKYDVDWKLVPAISGVESTFGRFIPANSYNAYGWNNGNFAFKDWPQSIEVVNKTLRENYINKGATTVERIAPIYAPPSNTWAGKVRYFMTKIEATPLDLELTI